MSTSWEFPGHLGAVPFGLPSIEPLAALRFSSRDRLGKTSSGRLHCLLFEFESSSLLDIFCWENGTDSVVVPPPF